MPEVVHMLQSYEYKLEKSLFCMENENIFNKYLALRLVRNSILIMTKRIINCAAIRY